MALFLLVFFAVYGAMNGYLLWTLYRGFAGRLHGWILPALLFALMTASPLLLRTVEHAWPLPLARAVHLLVWTWMALVFWGDCLALLFDLWNGAAWCLATLARVRLRLHCSYRVFPWVLGGVWTVLLLWGLWEGNRLELRTVQLKSSRLPHDASPLRLVQVSDLHLGLTTRERRLNKLLERIREAEPDLIVATGDIIDGGGVHMDELMPPWHTLNPTFGKVAVLGNHEVYAGTERSIELLETAGFVLLRGETAHFGRHWLLAGVDDPAVRRRRPPAENTDTLTLPNPRSERFVILLKHQPLVADGTHGNVDLQLSGHTHGGQIFPFGFFVRLVYPFPHGKLLTQAEDLHLYVSRGAGLWGPPLRVLAPAEVTLFIISPDQ